MEKTERTLLLARLTCLCGECWFRPHCFIAKGYERNLAADAPAQPAIPTAA